MLLKKARNIQPLINRNSHLTKCHCYIVTTNNGFSRIVLSYLDINVQHQVVTRYTHNMIATNK